MQNLYVRCVFFVRDTPDAMNFYTNTLGFNLDWTYEEQGRPYVIQVSLMGMELIINQQESPDSDHPGKGRLFVGMDQAQSEALLQHIADKGIKAEYTHWGAPTLAITDPDGNELYFWLSDEERVKWQQAHAEAD